MSASTFIAAIAPAAIQATAGAGLFPSVAIAQTCLETGFGEHFIGNNLYGIKAAGELSPYWNGDTVTRTTDGAKFRAYNTVNDSIKDYVHFLLNNSRYPAAGVFTASSPQEQIDRIIAAGYAGKNNTTYSPKIKDIIKDFYLEKYDQTTPTDTGADVITNHPTAGALQKQAKKRIINTILITGGALLLLILLIYGYKQYSKHHRSSSRPE